MTMRTRFAPSPTGELHIGSARVALYCYLYAKHHGGKWVLRIEDTDVERSTTASVQAILDGLAWLKLPYDEGPYYQTQHFPRYHAVLAAWLQEGKAYRCYCSKEHLEALREAQIAAKEKPRYDGRCRSLTQSQDAPFVIRFKNPTEGDVHFHDAVRGDIQVANSELDDLILARSDGTPTYNFTVVVDDYDMKITHVIRGDDHINNTPRQINLLKALGAEPPIYAHLPMILGEDGKRLSKRHGATGVMQFREEGILPEALLNYLVRLGWSHGDQEIFSREEMIAYFDLNTVSRSPAAMNRDKLLWLNQHYMKLASLDVLAIELREQFKHLAVDVTHGPSLEDVAAAQRERCKTLREIAEKSVYFYVPYAEYDEKAVQKHFSADTVTQLNALHHAFSQIVPWEGGAAHQAMLMLAEASMVKIGVLAQAVRIAVTGSTVSPPMDVTLELLGRDEVLARIARTVVFCEGRG